MAIKRPSFQFYPGDWLRDTGLRSCTVGARGLWVDMLCLMHDGKPYGHLQVGGKSIDHITLARMVGASENSVEIWLKELEESFVLSRKKDGTIYSRRMVKDEQIRRKRRKAGSLGGNPLLNQRDNQKDNQRPKQNLTPSSSSSSSSSSSKEKPTVSEKKSEPPPHFMIVPLRGQETLRIDAAQVDELKELFPTLDVEQELRSMKGNHQTKGLKTKRGINAAIQAWMRIAIKIQNEARTNGHKPDFQSDLGKSDHPTKKFTDEQITAAIPIVRRVMAEIKGLPIRELIAKRPVLLERYFKEQGVEYDTRLCGIAQAAAEQEQQRAERKKSKKEARAGP